MKIDIEQRDIEVLALASALAMEQRVADRGHRADAGVDIAERSTGHHRRAVGIALHIEDA
jgi:hypothetical protein